MSIELVILASHLRMFNVSFQYDDERILTTFGFQFIKETIMRYVNVINYEDMGVDYYTLDFKWKDSIWVKEDHTTVKRTSEFNWSRHFMSWRRFKKFLKKNNATFINN